MTVELRPLGIRCNIGCKYCYQDPMRSAGNFGVAQYNIDQMIQIAAEAKSELSLFGGEPLLIPKDDIEKVFRWSYEHYGRGGIQTNGTLIDDDHICIFKQYNVGVGISIDGPDELNDLRWAYSLEKTRDATAKTIANIERLVRAGIRVSVIVTLHRLNGTPERLVRLKEFIRWLGDIGVQSGNIHTLEVDSEVVAEKYCLTSEEESEAFLDLARFFDANTDLHWAPFRDMQNLLRGDNTQAICVWQRCDPMTTAAVYGVEGDGGLSNCGRTNKEGIDWHKAAQPGYERYISLYHTPQEYAGCQDCRFFLVCGGQCPGESDAGDWRNRTRHCWTLKELFSYYEWRLINQGVVPISRAPDRVAIERFVVSNLEQGQNVSLAQAVQMVRSGQQVSMGTSGYSHGDQSHGDRPHGDSHGDHTDQARVRNSPHGDLSGR